MIRLTRLRQTDPFWVNPDHIERVEHHHDTHVHLFGGTEFVVSECPEEIVARVLAQRARVLASAARLTDQMSTDQMSTDQMSTDQMSTGSIPDEVSAWQR